MGLLMALFSHRAKPMSRGYANMFDIDRLVCQSLGAPGVSEGSLTRAPTTTFLHPDPRYHAMSAASVSGLRLAPVPTTVGMEHPVTRSPLIDRQRMGGYGPPNAILEVSPSNTKFRRM